MTLQEARLGKCLITFLAAKRFLLSMDPNVSLHVARLGECLITFFANIWFLPRLSE